MKIIIAKTEPLMGREENPLSKIVKLNVFDLYEPDGAIDGNPVYTKEVVESIVDFVKESRYQIPEQGMPVMNTESVEHLAFIASIKHFGKIIREENDFTNAFKIGYTKAISEMEKVIEESMDEAMKKVELNNPDNSDSHQREQSYDYFICAGASEYQTLLTNIILTKLKTK